MSSKYPIQNGDDQGIIDAINYLLSGPGGLGQYFKGFSSYATAWLTGNFRVPFTQDTTAQLYVGDIALSNAEQLDSRTIKYTFSSAQPTPPFALGNGIYVSGVTPSSYNTSQLKYAGYGPYQIGVVECTTTYVIIRLAAAITGSLGTYVSGGATSFSTTGDFRSTTDCNARVVVTGGTDRVFISAQLDNIISYEVFDPTADLTYTVSVDRYIGFLNDDPTNPDYLFNDDGTIAAKTYTFAGLTGTGTLPLTETIFATLIDQPAPGYYWYLLQVKFNSDQDMQVTTSEFGLRSLSAQVVKQ